MDVNYEQEIRPLQSVSIYDILVDLIKYKYIETQCSEQRNIEFHRLNIIRVHD